MSRPKRLRGHESCCDGNPPYWGSPYVIGVYGTQQPAGLLTDPEKNAISLIEGRTLWSVDSHGNRLIPAPGLPRIQHDADLLREQAALDVIARGEGELNKIRDTWPMPLGWYKTNGLPQNTTDRRAHNSPPNPSHPMGAHRGETLWCPACKTAGEEFLEGLAYSLGEMTPALRILAMAASYIPVFGTAVSFIINTSLTLAEGGSLDEAVVDGIGKALPGQPASGIAFNAIRSVAKGDRLDTVAIEALPIDAATKTAIRSAVAVVEAIANGQPMTRLVTDRFYAELPDEGKMAMDMARRVLTSGQSIRDALTTEAMQAIKDLAKDQSPEAVEKFINAAQQARSQGSAAVERFITEAGYQGALSSLPPDMQRAVTVALITGGAQKKQFIGTFTTAEQNKTGNDLLAEKGQQIVRSGISSTYPGLSGTLADIRASGRVTITRDTFDPLSGRYLPRVEEHAVDDLWRRGFDVAVGLCDGMSEDGPGQQKVRASLVRLQAQKGFDVGQAIQHERTLHRQRLMETMARIDVHALSYGTAKREALGIAAPVPETAAQNAVALAKASVVKALPEAAAIPVSAEEQSTFASPTLLPSDRAKIEQAVAKDILRLTWVRYYKMRKASDPTVVH